MAETDTTKKREPREVLQDKMLFYDEVAKQLLVKIIDALNSDDRPRGDVIALMYKKMSECDKIAIECADKLAPYLHPKLSSIEMNKKVEHRYVVRVPTIINDPDAWMKAVENGAKHQGDATNNLIASLERKKNKINAEDAQIIDGAN